MENFKNIEFVEKCRIVHSDKYDYSKTLFLNVRTKIIVICNEHGEFSINPDNHIRLKQGCKKCALNKHKLTYIDNQRLEKMKEIHKNKYVYNDLCIIDSKINIVCEIHGTFKQIIYHHERGHGCPKCSLKLCIGCGKNKKSSSFLNKSDQCSRCCEQIKKELPVLEKSCITCNQLKKVEEFPTRKDSKAGYRNECSICYDNKSKERKKIYRQVNKKKLREYDLIYRKRRMETDPFFKAKMIARDVIRKSITKSGYTKKSRTYEILGCSYIEFKQHIESLFLVGMGWDNRDEWDIDHIVPMDFAQNEKELLLLNNYQNLRPLWKIENSIKSNTIYIKNSIYEQIISLRDVAF